MARFSLSFGGMNTTKTTITVTTSQGGEVKTMISIEVDVDRAHLVVTEMILAAMEMVKPARS